MQLFCDYGLSSVPTKRKQAVMQPITCAFAPQSAIGKLATIRNRKKVAKMSRFLFLDSRSSFGMTIWPGRTQRSIVSSFAAAPMRDNRILRSVVPWASSAYRTAWCWSGGTYRTARWLPWTSSAYRTAWRLPWAARTAQRGAGRSTRTVQRGGSRGRRHASPNKKAAPKLGAALLAIFRSAPLL